MPNSISVFVKSPPMLFFWAVFIGLTSMQRTAAGSPGPNAEANSPPEASANDPNRWGPLKLIEGTWEGSIDGKLGKGRGIRRYEFVLSNHYLVMRHDSVRPPQEKSKSGDHHGELSIFSYDREAEIIVLREFMEEGYVLQSACTTYPDRIVCNAEAIESGPGMKARLTITMKDAYRFEERFELAAPDEELQHYFTNVWTRIPDFER